MKIEVILRNEKADDHSDDKIGLSWMLRRGYSVDVKGIRVNDSSVWNPTSSRDMVESHAVITSVRSEGLFAIPKSSDLVGLISNLIESAREVVCISSYLIQSSPVTDSMLSAAGKGVRVYVLTAGEDQLKVADDDESSPDERKNEFIKLLGKLSGKVLLRTGDFHAKFLLTDPASSDSKGLMFTSNLTVDALSGVNQELAVRLTSQEILSFFRQFIIGFWNLSRHELRGGRLQELPEHRYETDVDAVKVYHPCTCGEIMTIKEVALDLIQGAKSTIIISAWTFSPDTEIPNALLRQADKGVEIFIYTRPNYLNASTLEKLAEKGISVMAHKRYHAKTIVIDGDRSLITTANFSEQGLNEGFETGVLRSGEDALMLSNIINEWERDCEWILSSQSRLGDHQSKIIEIDKSKQEDVIKNVIETKVIPVGDEHPIELKTKDEIKWPETIYKNEGKELCKKILFQQSVFMPMLPKGAGEVKKGESKYTFYEKKGDKHLYLPISDWDELVGAREEAKKFGASVVMR